MQQEAVEELDFLEIMTLSEDQKLRQHPLWTAVTTERGDQFALGLAQKTVAQWVDVDEPVEFQGAHNSTPLLFASLTREPEFLKFLISQGANVDAMNSIGFVPLTYALQGQRLDNFRQLIDAGANPDPLESGKGAFSPLAMAAEFGVVEAVKVLIELGADVNWRSDNGTDSMKFASARGEVECFDLLLNAGGDPASFDSEGFSGIHNAVDNQYHDVVVKLLDAGVDVNLRFKPPSEENGETPLHRACARLDLEMVKILVGRGADINALSEDSSTPLSYVYLNGDEEDDAELIQYLIDHGANPDL